MLIRTHLVGTLFLVLLFLNKFEPFWYKVVFVIVALIATFIPDIDTRFSKAGRKKIFRIIQFFSNHRGVFHSFSFLILLCVFFVFILPWIVLPFFVGYGMHLFLDCFTKQGIYPLWPWKRKCSWIIRTGSRIETFIFALFFALNIILIILKIKVLF